MKKIIVALAILIGGTNVLVTTPAQAKVNVTFNIGNQPLWGPTGYDYVQYYYLPDINVYYDIANRLFYYQGSKNNWYKATTLPSKYGRYDLYKLYKVVITSNQKPYYNNVAHIRQYAKYKGVKNQTPIRDARDMKYYENKNHPRHNEWVKNNGSTQYGNRDNTHNAPNNPKNNQPNPPKGSTNTNVTPPRDNSNGNRNNDNRNTNTNNKNNSSNPNDNRGTQNNHPRDNKGANDNKTGATNNGNRNDGGAPNRR